jgi:hypothetical protein
MPRVERRLRTSSERQRGRSILQDNKSPSLASHPPGGFLAAGPSGAPSCVSGMWSSPDGRAWLCISGNPGLVGFGPYAAAASPDLVVVVGLQDTREDTAPIGAIWVSAAG